MELSDGGWAQRFIENWKDSLKWQRLKPYAKFADMIEEAQEKEVIREKLVESIREKTDQEERSSCYFI